MGQTLETIAYHLLPSTSLIKIIEAYVLSRRHPRRRSGARCLYQHIHRCIGTHRQKRRQRLAVPVKIRTYNSYPFHPFRRYDTCHLRIDATVFLIVEQRRLQAFVDLMQLVACK